MEAFLQTLQKSRKPGYRRTPMSLDHECILLTGATGFIGHHLVAELLRRGRDGERIAVALRPPIVESLQRLRQLTRELGIDLSAHIDHGRIIPVRFDLTSEEPLTPIGGIRVTSIIHAAAVTRFVTDAAGEPQRTNVAGTQRLLDWARRNGVRDFHLVSSAYACGRAAELVPETAYPARPEFHNDYEQSKWDAEHHCRRAAGQRNGPTLTVHRPSIVVGDFASGRASKLDGFYVTVRATELLARSYEGATRTQRHAIPLRISGRPDDRQDIVPVDYVAAMIAAIQADPRRHGRTYHLTHPHPPTNAAIKAALETHYDIAGGRFVDPASFDSLKLNDAERLFREVSQPVAHYFTDTPQFARENAEQIERETGICCPRYDEPALRCLFRGATEAASRARRGRRRSGNTLAADPQCAIYFERFLPARIASSRVARTTAMDVTIRFIIEPNGGDWVCRFDRGQLTRVVAGHHHTGAIDFGYRADVPTFYKAISGRAHPQEFFFGSGAEVFGDIERALKMAMILNAFSREHPCDRRMLIDEGRLAC